jgi:hypothetical protein
MSRLRRLLVIGCALAPVMIVGLVGTTTGAALASSSSDAQIAQAGTLVASDLSADWTQHARDTSGDKQAESIASTISACKQYLALRRASKSSQRVSARSPDFDLGESTFDNTVYVFPAVSSASTRMSQLGHSNLPQCANKLFAALIKRSVATAGGAKVRTVAANFQPNTDIKNYGDETLSYEGPVKVTLTDGEAMSLGVGMTAVRVGRGVLLYSYLLTTDSADAATPALDPAVQSSVSRFASALGAAS